MSLKVLCTVVLAVFPTSTNMVSTNQHITIGRSRLPQARQDLRVKFVCHSGWPPVVYSTVAGSDGVTCTASPCSAAVR